ncbi:MAG: hypothetical protein H0W65_07500 [Sphingomonas sp.]|uniref:hypothetical protein n=1 Tax=Sphingomonas sp. TaxID=28214 RepID=UPI0017B58C84|nr:hypothetical protein [Sphingomonas sp.]MBA3667550.1 hypothetical protein [Sphingomonas sp.]
MSRVLNLSMSETAAIDHCKSHDVGVSAIEKLPSGGIRLVCMSSDGAERVRKTLKAKLIKGDVVRARYRPTRPLW